MNIIFDDCNSTQELVDWLRLRQKEYGIPYLGKTETVDASSKEEVADRILLRDRLLKKAEQLMEAGATENAKLTSLLAWILEFHRREKKPMYWRLFDRMGLSDEELVDDPDCLAQCMRTEKTPYKPTPQSKNYVYEYSFEPNQEFKGACDKYFVLGHVRDNGNNLSVTVLKEDSRFGDGLIGQ